MANELATDTASIARFTREASTAAAVKSPHVVQMLDHGVAEGTPYIVMEYLEGIDLRRHLLDKNTLPLEEIGAILTQCSKAMSRAHEQNVIHRDIKPDNIFLCNVGPDETFVKLLDFGVAKKIGTGDNASATRTGAMVGTPLYMSPEQALGSKTIDFRTDLWSLGVVTYLAMTGAFPFHGESLGAIVMAICHDPLPVPSHVNPALSPAIDAWFERACARDPNSRFASAKEMASAFQIAINASSRPSGPQPSGPQPLSQPSRPTGPQPFSGNVPIVSGPPVQLPVGAVTTTAGLSETQEPRKKSNALLGVMGMLAALAGAAVVLFVVAPGAKPTPTPLVPTVGSHALPAPSPSPLPPPVNSEPEPAPPPTTAPLPAPKPAASPKPVIIPRPPAPTGSRKPARDDHID